MKFHNCHPANTHWATTRVGCSFSADTYIFRAGSAKNGCSIVEERLLSAIKEDGAKDPWKKNRISTPVPPLYLRGFENFFKTYQITKIEEQKLRHNYVWKIYFVN